jgi:predicted DNA-binding transcriptional regulator AlpA
MSSITPALLTEAQTAEYLGISLSTIRRWRKQSGTGPAYFRVSDCLRYHRSELDKFIAEHTTQPSAGEQ